MVIIAGVMNINYRPFLIIIAAILMAGCLSSQDRQSASSGKYDEASIPEDYYFGLKAADIDSPIELVRFATTIKPDTSTLDIPMKAAYYQWYLKNRGFNVSFVYTDNFRNQGIEHVWLLVKNQQGESMYVDPSYDKMKADSICPTMSEYKNYQKTYLDIYDLAESTGGAGKYAWWRTSQGKELFNISVMLLKKQQL
jgi:hypothetical protein